MHINEEVLQRAKLPDALIVFLHCQRTGGSNLQRWFRKAFPPEAIFSRETPGYVQWHNSECEALLRSYKLVSGFSQYRRSTLSRPVVFITNVRHPFYRIVSLYKMSRAAETHFLHHLARDSSFEDFYLKGREIKPFYFHNLACRRIAGEADIAVALANIKRDFGLIASTNRLHEASCYLREALQWNVEPMGHNGAPPDEVNYASYDSSPVHEEILANNQDDLRLFEMVQAGDKNTHAVLLATMPAPAKHTAAGGADPNPGVETDKMYAKYKEKHPTATFSEFYTRTVAGKVSQGSQHNSLGKNIVTGDRVDFWETGLRQAQRMMRLGDIQPGQKVVEYGCGSLRLGAHFIKFLHRGHYFGLDIIADFFEIGRAHVGAELLADKTPALEAIGPESVQRAIAFQADYVFSHAVLIHVHPDDVEVYFSNLKVIAHRRECLLAFNAMIHPTPVRYNNLGWAWPEDHILGHLAGFEAVRIDIAKRPTVKNGVAVHGAMFVMKRV